MSLNTLTRLVCHCLFKAGYLCLCFLLQRFHKHIMMDFRLCIFLIISEQDQSRGLRKNNLKLIYTHIKYFNYPSRKKKKNQHNPPTNLTPFENADSFLHSCLNLIFLSNSSSFNHDCFLHLLCTSTSGGWKSPFNALYEFFIYLFSPTNPRLLI